MSCFVCVGPPNNTVAYPPLVPGISNAVQWRPGGIPGQSPPFPMNIVCDTDDEAQEIWRLMQPWAIENHHRSRDQQIVALDNDPRMVQLAQLVEQVPNRKYWAVRLGSTVGIYFSGREAMANMDGSASIRFRRAFSFHEFLLVVKAMISNNPASLGPLDDYYPSKHPVQAEVIRNAALAHINNLSFQPTTPTPSPAPLPPTQDHAVFPTPSTPSRAGGASSQHGTPSSHHATPAARTPGRGTRWGDNEIAEVEDILLRAAGSDDFVDELSLSLGTSEAISRFLWVLIQGR
ncbi:hypothetical protein VKT23_019887 [Stygiomarasmius scandens]|uniref:Uncharacterized protein n=1 Tax=Marasmiellus scandens TaxID=2682957 RepID=A0ABR1IK73_9AGAR